MISADRQPVEANPARAVAYGSISGMIVAQLFTFELHSIIGGAILEFGLSLYGLITIILAVILSSAIAFPFAATTAFPFVLLMMNLEGRHPWIAKPVVWSAIGALVSTPLGLWLAWVASGYEYDGGWNWNFLPLVWGSGLVGGSAAWLGYFKSNLETHPEQHDIRAS